MTKSGRYKRESSGRPNVPRLEANTDCASPFAVTRAGKVYSSVNKL